MNGTKYFNRAELWWWTEEAAEISVFKIHHTCTVPLPSNPDMVRDIIPWEKRPYNKNNLLGKLIHHENLLLFKKNLNNFDDYFQKIASQEKLHSKSLQVSLWTNVWTRFAWSFIVGCSSLLANFCDLQNLLLKTQKIALRNPLSFYRPPSMNELSAYLSLELLQQLWCCWIRSFSTFPWIPLSWMQWKTQSLMKTNVNLTWSNAGQLNAQMTPGDNSKYVSATRSR